MPTRSKTIDLLNQLLGIVYRSFPNYLADASPWSKTDSEGTTRTLENIVSDQQASAKRIGDLVLDLGGRINPGEFPMEYTDSHFLSMNYLLTEMLRYQRRDVASIQRIAAQLVDHPRARELAEETLGSERAHLESLEALVGQLA